MPGHRRRTLLVALQAQILAGLFPDLAVRVVAGGAVEAVGAADLVRAGDPLHVGLVAVALVADVRRGGAHVVRCAAQRGLVGRLLVADQGHRCSTVAGEVRFGRGRRPRRDVVVARVAVGAGHVVVRVLRDPPAGSRRTVVLLVAPQAQLGLLRRGQRLEAEDQARFLAPRLNVLAGRPVAGFAGLALLVQPPVDVLLERLGVRLVAGQAQLVVVDVLGVRDRRQDHPQHRQRGFTEYRVRFGELPGPPRLHVGVRTAPGALRDAAGSEPEKEDPQQNESSGRSLDAKGVAHVVASLQLGSEPALFTHPGAEASSFLELLHDSRSSCPVRREIWRRCVAWCLPLPGANLAGVFPHMFLRPAIASFFIRLCVSHGRHMAMQGVKLHPVSTG